MPRVQGEDLREACLREALTIIESQGLEALSLREVSRRLGVSHQAPYKHFPSRDHILAEVIRRAFDSFAAALDARPHTDDPVADFGEMGRVYLHYAAAHPLQYRLMFGTALPNPAAHPEMTRSAQHAFALLRDCIARLSAAGLLASPTTLPDMDALFAWSTLHGLVSILQMRTDAMIALPDNLLPVLGEHLLWRIGLALGISDGPSHTA